MKETVGKKYIKRHFIVGRAKSPMRCHFIPVMQDQNNQQYTTCLQIQAETGVSVINSKQGIHLEKHFRNFNMHLVKQSRNFSGPLCVYTHMHTCAHTYIFTQSFHLVFISIQVKFQNLILWSQFQMYCVQFITKYTMYDCLLWI